MDLDTSRRDAGALRGTAAAGGRPGKSSLEDAGRRKRSKEANVETGHCGVAFQGENHSLIFGKRL